MDTPEEIINKVIDEQVDRILVAIGRTPARYVAREIGIHEQTVADVISRRRRPTMKTLRLLSERYL